MRQLAEHLTVAVNSMTSIADSLERKALVLRHRSEEDRRVIRVELTDLGREIYRSLMEANLQLLRSMLGALTEDEQEIFMVLFRRSLVPDVLKYVKWPLLLDFSSLRPSFFFLIYFVNRTVRFVN